MSKKRIPQPIERKKNRETAAVVADIAHVSPRYVRMVMEGDKKNEDILTASILYQQGKSELIKQIKELVPFS